jgi:hypothetical protein
MSMQHIALHCFLAHRAACGACTALMLACCSFSPAHRASPSTMPSSAALQPVQASQRVAFLNDCKRPLSNLGPFWTGGQGLRWLGQQRCGCAALQCGAEPVTTVGELGTLSLLAWARPWYAGVHSVAQLFTGQPREAELEDEAHED